MIIIIVIPRLSSNFLTKKSLFWFSVKSLRTSEELKFGYRHEVWAIFGDDLVVYAWQQTRQ